MKITYECDYCDKGREDFSVGHSSATKLYVDWPTPE